jgi:hypothetical protein
MLSLTHSLVNLSCPQPTRLSSYAFSKDLDMHCAAAAWEDLVYNLARPLKSLRLPVTDHPTRRWQQRTPAMAAGLTDHIWSFRELLFTIPLPDS